MKKSRIMEVLFTDIKTEREALLVEVVTVVSFISGIVIGSGITLLLTKLL